MKKHIAYTGSLRDILKKYWGVSCVYEFKVFNNVILEAQEIEPECREVVIFESGRVSVVDTIRGLKRVKFGSLREYLEFLKNDNPETCISEQ